MLLKKLYETVGTRSNALQTDPHLRISLNFTVRTKYKFRSRQQRGWSNQLIAYPRSSASRAAQRLAAAGRQQTRVLRVLTSSFAPNLDSSEDRDFVNYLDLVSTRPTDATSVGNWNSPCFPADSTRSSRVLARLGGRGSRSGTGCRCWLSSLRSPRVY